MIDQGFEALVQSALPSGVLVCGVQLPKDWIIDAKGNLINTTAVTWRCILSTPYYEMNGQDSCTKNLYQLDCYGSQLAFAATTARAIARFLSGGWTGTLTDSDSTKVNRIFRTPTWISGFRDEDRSFVVSSEYEIYYYET